MRAVTRFSQRRVERELRAGSRMVRVSVGRAFV